MIKVFIVSPLVYTENVYFLVFDPDVLLLVSMVYFPSINFDMMLFLAILDSTGYLSSSGYNVL